MISISGGILPSGAPDRKYSLSAPLTGKTEYWAPQVRSNRRLKRYFMHLAMQHAALDVRSSAYYQKKLAEGKRPLQARRALARQLVRVVYKMLKTSQPFKG